jgi:VanZ family protein
MVQGARVGLALLLIAVTWLALIPVTAVPVTTFWDKADHALGFFTLTLLARLALPQLHFWRVLAPAVLAYGIGLEVAQSFTATRTASLLDVVADGVGILLFAAVAAIVRQRQR